MCAKCFAHQRLQLLERKRELSTSRRAWRSLAIYNSSSENRHQSPRRKWLLKKTGSAALCTAEVPRLPKSHPPSSKISRYFPSQGSHRNNTSGGRGNSSIPASSLLLPVFGMFFWVPLATEPEFRHVISKLHFGKGTVTRVSRHMMEPHT